MGGPGPYRQWPAGHHTRWARTANLFGQHLMREWRSALNQLPASASDEAKTLVEQAGIGLLHGLMAIFDGVPSLETEDGYRVEYVLSARIQERQQSGDWTAVETIELAPGGDGLCLGLAGWVKGDFDSGNEELKRSLRTPEETHEQTKKQYEEMVQTKRQGIERRTAGGPPCPHCGKPLRTAKAKQCFHCGRNWHESQE